MIACGHRCGGRQRHRAANARVVLDDDVARGIDDFKQGAGDIVENVVPYGEPPRLAAWTEIVVSEDHHPVHGSPHHIVRELDILDRGPRASAVLIPRSDDDCVTRLGVRPVVFQDIVVDKDLPCVLEFKQIFHDPVRPRVGGIRNLPGGRLPKMISLDLDVCRDEPTDRRIRAAKHDVFAGSFEVVVADDVRTCAIPSGDCL